MKIKSIGTKIIIPIVLIILVAGIITVEVVRRTFQETLTVALKEKGMSVCRYLAVASLEPIISGNEEELQRLLQEHKQSVSDLSYAFITDMDDNILAHTFLHGFPLHLLWANRITSPQQVSVKFPEIEKEIIYDFAVPIVSNSKMIGTARVGLSKKSMQSAIAKITVIAIMIILSVLTLGVLVAIWLTRAIVKPIESLHHSAEIIGAGDLEHRIVIETGDEIEQLANAFNKMVAGLKEKSNELRKSEAKYRTLVESSPDMIHLIDRSGRFLSVNQMEIETLGYTQEEFLAMMLKDIISPDYIEDTRTAIQTVKEQGKITYETELVSKDGRRIPVEVNAVANRDVEGNFVSALGIARDITERKRAENELRAYRDHLEELVKDRTTELTRLNEQLKQEITERAQVENDLRESEEKFRAISFSAQDAIIMMDNEGRISFWNKAAERIFGHSRPEALGRVLHSFLAPQRYYETYRKAFSIYKTKGQGAVVGRTLELVAVRKDGTEFPIELSLSAINIKGAWNAIGIVRDITERKETEKILRESEHSLSEAQRIAHLGNWDWNIVTDDLFWSDEIYRIFGLQSQKFGATYDAFLNSVHQDDRESVRRAVNGAVSDPNAIYDIEHRVVRPDGAERVVHEQGEVIFDDTGKPVRMMGTVLDITERIHAEEALRNAQARLAQSEKMASLGMLVAGVAHEINNPAGAVNSMHDTLMRAIGRLKSALIRQSSVSEEVNALFKTMEEANRVIDLGMDRVTNIVKRLRSFARLDEAELKKVDIHDGIEDVLTIIDHELKQKAVVERNFGDIPPIYCYPSQLNQVYLNLLNNSLEAIKREGKITITTFQKGNSVYIQFKDTGIGIPPEMIKTIFDPGYTTKGAGVGTALGLPICYQIVKAHGGEILVESEVGKGTTFTIILPTQVRQYL